MTGRRHVAATRTSTPTSTPTCTPSEDEGAPPDEQHPGLCFVFWFDGPPR